MQQPPPSASTASPGSVVDGRDDAAAVADRRQLLDHLELLYNEVVSRFELLPLFVDNERAALRGADDELRVSMRALYHRIKVVGGKLRLRLSEERPLPAVPMLLPKNVSIRSPRYYKPKKDGNNPPSTHLAWVRSTPSGEVEENPRIYKNFQGMLKTELCRRWEENGACQYDDKCHFAHGVAELRPVIRNPQYKTKPCRMVLAGDICPYGHRCHFQHFISPAGIRYDHS